MSINMLITCFMYLNKLFNQIFYEYLKDKFLVAWVFIPHLQGVSQVIKNLWAIISQKFLDGLFSFSSDNNCFNWDRIPCISFVTPFHLGLLFVETFELVKLPILLFFKTFFVLLCSHIFYFCLQTRHKIVRVKHVQLYMYERKCACLQNCLL